MKTYKITTLGCKVNQYESAAFAATLSKMGLIEAKDGQIADLVAINSCCITTTAMRKSRQAIRKLVRNNPGCAVAVIGCLSTYHEKNVRDILTQADIPAEKILVAGHHGDILAELEIMLAGQQGENPAAPTPDTIKRRRLDAIDAQPNATENLERITTFDGHQRAFVKIQDGCDALCSYCVVPFTRSRVWSREISDIVAECTDLVNSGHREIVLCGVFIGAFGRDTAVRRNWSPGPAKLVEVLKRVADIPDIWRVRLGSIEPLDVTDEMLEACRDNPKIAPHFHMALQSGSTKILGLMNRQYTSEEFRAAAANLHSALDNPAITTDIIVGFPEETDEDFAQTLETAQLAKFSKIHAFPFSAIEPTPAWHRRSKMPPRDVVKARLEQLAQLEAQLAGDYQQKFIGKHIEALVENSAPPAGYSHIAMTDRYLSVAFNGPESLNPSDIVMLQVTGTADNCLVGKIK